MKDSRVDWKLSEILKELFRRGKSYEYEDLNEADKLYAILMELDDPNSDYEEVRRMIIHHFKLDRNVSFDNQIETLLWELENSAASNLKSDEAIPPFEHERIDLIKARLEFLRHSLVDVGVRCAPPPRD